MKTTTPDVFQTLALRTRRNRAPARKVAREQYKAMQASGMLKSRRLAAQAVEQGK